MSDPKLEAKLRANAEEWAPLIERAKGNAEAAHELAERLRADSLDAAWAEAEALVPVGELHLHRIKPSAEYQGPYLAVGLGRATEGPTPAAALRALAAKLRETR